MVRNVGRVDMRAGKATAVNLELESLGVIGTTATEPLPLQSERPLLITPFPQDQTPTASPSWLSIAVLTTR